MSPRFPTVDWYCDECNEYLNVQPGFTDQNETWTCTDCGHENSISSDAILFTGEELDQKLAATWSESDNHGFANELDYLRSLKKDDSYTFTYPFEYIAKNHGNGNYDIDTADMVVRVEWDDSNAGYAISYDVSDMYKIDPAQGNSDAEGFYEYDVRWRLKDDLESLGIGFELTAL